MITAKELYGLVPKVDMTSIMAKHENAFRIAAAKGDLGCLIEVDSKHKEIVIDYLRSLGYTAYISLQGIKLTRIDVSWGNIR